MALLDDILGIGIGEMGTGLLFGLGAIVLVPVVLPVVGAVAKPVAKAAIKGGLLLAEKVKVTVAEVKESMENVTAEAKAELAPKGIEAQGEANGGAA
jgi:galactitol-specific phosphotransferase system IIC component